MSVNSQVDVAKRYLARSDRGGDGRGFGYGAPGRTKIERGNLFPKRSMSVIGMLRQLPIPGRNLALSIRGYFLISIAVGGLQGTSSASCITTSYPEGGWNVEMSGSSRLRLMISL